MRKGIKFSLGAWMAAAAFAVCPTTLQAAELGDTVEPAVALVMPFNVTEGRASFELVSRSGGEDSNPIATHWSYWSESADHVADVFICLTCSSTAKIAESDALRGLDFSPIFPAETSAFVSPSRDGGNIPNDTAVVNVVEFETSTLAEHGMARGSFDASAFGRSIAS